MKSNNSQIHLGTSNDDVLRQQPEDKDKLVAEKDKRTAMPDQLLDERGKLLDEKERLIKVYESMMNK